MLDKQLYSIFDLNHSYGGEYYWDPKRIEDFRKKIVSNAFEYHYENCERYRNYCKGYGIAPDDIYQSGDITKIPQIPTVLFKNADILSVPRESIVKLCTSSGTHGHFSKVFRDQRTLDNFVFSILGALKEIYEVNLRDSAILYLGPNIDEAGGVWQANIVSVFQELSEVHTFVKHGEFLARDLYEYITTEISDRKLFLFGPPITLKYFIEFLKENNLQLNVGSDYIVIMGGGWKKFSGEMIEREPFEELMHQYIGVDRGKIFDTFNQVELNTTFFECRNKRKHILPWVKVIVRDPVTLEPLGYEQEGLLSYMDASALSYPCFIISEDIGVLHKGCDCGLTSETMEILRRVSKVEAKGCALKIESGITRNQD